MVRPSSAKALCAGSIPARASNFLPLKTRVQVFPSIKVLCSHRLLRRPFGVSKQLRMRVFKFNWVDWATHRTTGRSCNDGYDGDNRQPNRAIHQKSTSAGSTKERIRVLRRASIIVEAYLVFRDVRILRLSTSCQIPSTSRGTAQTSTLGAATLALAQAGRFTLSSPANPRAGDFGRVIVTTDR